MLSKKKEKEYLDFGARSSLIAIARILALCILKAVTGVFTGMVVLIADALASFSDVLGLFASYIGLKISEKSADKGFRYGYYKVETLASLFVSFIILYFGVKIFMDSLEVFYAENNSSNQILGVIVVVVATVQSIYLARSLKKAGKKINSLSLMNCAKDKLIDVYVQFAVLLGIGANFFHIPYLEGSVGMAISIMTLKVGYDSAKESIFFLLDYFDDQELIKKIETTIKKESKIITGIAEIRLRRAGTFIFGEGVIEIDPYSETKDIRDIIKNLSAKIVDLDDYMKHFSILVAIPRPRKIRVAIPVKKYIGIKSEVATTQKETTAYVFMDIKGKKITDHFMKKFNFKQSDFKKMTDYFVSQKTDIIINSNMHSLLFYNLRHLNHIMIYPNFDNVMDVENTVKLLILDT